MNKMPLWILVILMTGCSSGAKNVQDAVMDALPEAGIPAYDQVFYNLTAPHVSQSVSRPMNSLKIFNISGASSVSVTFYRNWGRPNQKSKIVTMRLDSANVNQEIGNYRLE